MTDYTTWTAPANHVTAPKPSAKPRSGVSARAASSSPFFVASGVSRITILRRACEKPHKNREFEPTHVGCYVMIDELEAALRLGRAPHTALAGIKTQNVLMINGWRQTRRQQPTFIMTKPHIAQKSPIVQPAEPGEYWWCSCGLSATQPFCNGAHKGTGLAPLKVQITETKKVAWCACKQTKTPPFCDGSHRTLA